MSIWRSHRPFPSQPRARPRPATAARCTSTRTACACMATEQTPRHSRNGCTRRFRRRACGSRRRRARHDRPGMTVLLHYLPLLGVLVVVAGFALRFNPVPVVVVAGIVSGLAAGKSVGEILALIGTSFVSERALLLFVLTLPAIGVLERAGLREHARNWIASLRSLTFPRLLIAYLGLRQILSMLGLTSVAADNIGLFFGEDVFIALGAVLLIQGFYAQHGIELQPLHIALWALPTAIAAFIIHAIRTVLFGRRIARPGPQAARVEQAAN